MKRTVATFVLLLLAGAMASVSVSGTTWEVHPTPGVGHYTTIQAAINAASPGDTIRVLSADYHEDLVITKDNLDLEGEWARVYGVQRELSTNWPNALPNVDVRGQGVTIHGFQFHNPPWLDGYYSSGMIVGATNVEIYDNYFYGATSDDTDDISQCLQTRNGMDVSGLNIYGNTFQSQDNESYGYEAIYINAGGTGTATISGNYLYGRLVRGITTARERVEILNNEISTWLSGAFALAGINVDVPSVAVSGNRVLGGFQVAIDLGGPAVGLHDIVVAGNVTSDSWSNLSATGIRVRGNLTGATDVEIHSNHIQGTLAGLDAAGITSTPAYENYTVNATHNWWGDETGPSGGVADPTTGKLAEGTGNLISANARFDPWYEGAPLSGSWQTGVTSSSFDGVDVSVSPGGPGTIGIARTEKPGGIGAPGLDGIYLDVCVAGFAPGATVTITYHYDDWELAGLGIPETGLQLYYWDGSAWRGAAVVAIDTASDEATFRIPASALAGTPLTLAGTGATGDKETDVVDASANVPDVLINPGDTALVQTFKIGDPGTIGDTVPDGHDTYVETITVANWGSVGPAEVSRLYLYRDNGDTAFNSGTDTLIGTLNGFSGGVAVFGVPGSVLARVPNNTTAWFHVVAKFVGSGLTPNASYQSVVVDVTVDDPIGGRSSGLEWWGLLPAGSSRVLYTMKAASGAAESSVRDHTVAGFVAPGATNVVLQSAVLTDGDSTLPGIPPTDGHPTAVGRFVVRKASGTLDPAYVKNLRIYVENGMTPGFQPSEDYSWWGLAANPNLLAGVAFHNLPSVAWWVGDEERFEFYVVADIAAGAPMGATLTVSVDVQAGDGLLGGSADTISSRIATALPVVAGNPLTIGASVLGNQETDAVDETTLRTVLLGEIGVVVQTVRITDPGAGIDSVADGYPTRVDTVTITGAGLLATNGVVASLALYAESDGIDGWSSGDTPLGTTVTNPDLTVGARFGTAGTLLLLVPENTPKILYVVAGFKASGGANGNALTTTLNATVYQTAGTSSRFEPAGVPGALGVPVAASSPATLVVITGDREVDLTDETKALAIEPGSQHVVVQEFVLEDPGSRGDTVNDGFPLFMRDITVRFTNTSTVTDADINWIRLYRETDGNPGLTGGDAQVSGVAWQYPALDGRITFVPPVGAPAFWNRVVSAHRFYVVVDFLPGRPANGSQLTSTVTIKPIGGATSGIEDPQPLVATHAITVGVPQAVVDVYDLTIEPTQTGGLTISVNVSQLADFQVGTVGRLTITNSNKVNVTGIVGAGPYDVGSSSIVDPNTAGENIDVTFGIHLRAGQTPAAGPVAVLQVTGTGADGDTCAVDITSIDVLRNQAGASIAYSIDPGTITLSSGATAGPKGDVNDDGTVDITDARLVAEYSIGLTPVGTFIIARADVNGDGNIDVTDARWIAEAAIGLRTLSVATRVSRPTSLTQASVSINEFGELIVAGTNADVTDLQGTLYFDPNDVTVTAVGGANGFVVLASAIDDDAGWVKFAAAKLSGGAVGDAPVVLFEATGDVTSAVLDIDVLRDKSGQSVPFKTQSSGVGLITQFGCFPNPVQDVHTTYFSAKGTQPIESIRVEIYDFSGALVYDSGWGPNDLAWHVQNDAGDVLANGVYYYRMQVLFVGSDEPVTTKIGKVAVYR